MYYFKFIFLILMGFTLVQCASKEPKPLPLPDATEDAASADPLNPDAVASGETNEKDLEGASTQQKNDEFSSSPTQAQNQKQQKPMETPPPLDETPAPAISQNNSSNGASTDTGFPATMTALDFKANDNGGTVVVKTNRPVTYTTRRNNKNNQFIIELQNTQVPKKFTRSLNTKEFPGAIASINAYQSSGGQNIARVILQLREDVEPSVSQSGRAINIAAAGGGEQTPSTVSKPMAKNKRSAMNEDNGSDMQEEEDQSQNMDTGEPAVKADSRIMENKSFESFLLGQSKFYGRRISIEVTNQDIREVFKFISEESGMNIILDDDVKGTVTMKLKKVPWDQILAIVLQSRQLGYVRNGTILRIASLKNLATDSQNALRVIESQKDLQPIRVQVFPMSYAKVDEFMSEANSLLSKRGKASADKRTNTLIVSDISENLSKIKALISKLDTQTPQVLIEAKIVEAKDTFEKSVGVKWNANGGTTVVGMGARDTGPMTLVPTIASDPIGAAGSNSSLNLQLGTFDVIGNLNATLQLLETENQIKLISSPRIVALDRTEASIEQTSSFPIISTTLATATTPAIQTVTFKDIKLELKVTPQITVDGGVIMAIEVTRELKGAVIGGIPGVDRRIAKAQVLVENGDTIVLGGIYNSDVNVSESGVPILSKIPILGALFRYKDTAKTKNELVIFMTPRILNLEKAFVKNGAAM